MFSNIGEIIMNRVKIGELEFNQPCTIKGWLEKIRDSKYMIFLVVKDITGKIQVTIEKEKMPQLVEKLKGIIANSVVSVDGTAYQSEYVKMGGKEFIPTNIEVLSVAEALPIMDDANIDNKLDYRWIDLRTDRNILIFKIQSCFTNAMREF